MLSNSVFTELETPPRFSRVCSGVVIWRPVKFEIALSRNVYYCKKIQIPVKNYRDKPAICNSRKKMGRWQFIVASNNEIQKMTTPNFQTTTARRLLTQLMPQAVGADTTDYKQQLSAAQILAVGLPDQSAVTAGLVEQQKNAGRNILSVWPGDPQIEMVAAKNDAFAQGLMGLDVKISENRYMKQRA